MNKRKTIDIIAEIGQNFNGDIDLAKEMIKQAANAGANIVKFQLYDPAKRSDIKTHKWADILLQSKITRRQVFLLKDECDKFNVSFLASVFDSERVQWCEDIKMEAYKIASKSIYDVELARAVAVTGKPVILSYGMFKEADLPSIILEWYKDYDKHVRDIKLTKLYCISKYPADLMDMNFMFESGRQLDFIDMTVTIPVAYSIFESDYQGYSDHSIGLTACKTAMSLGARVIEKHLTMDKNMAGPDHIHSCTPDEMADLCKFRDEVEMILYGK
uniref:Putative N-acetylneuraminate synthase n=1 Tax=viral metagenome TaxID=1070528 RepID=A0A6M3L401_9ZZZZ